VSAVVSPDDTSASDDAHTGPRAAAAPRTISLITGDDGLPRCSWSGTDPEYRRYHDEEWGQTLHGDRPLFEKLSLEGFQAGLSWITILKRRPAFRAAFADFDIGRVAAMDDNDVDRLMADNGIIRNRQKILATIGNARIVRDLTRDNDGALDRMIWSFAPPASPRPADRTMIPAITPESAALSGALRKLGFRFVGPTTMYALMQSAGLVDDHVIGCWRSSGGAVAGAGA
jgi:DNA-3-methyladenine glycosylase I